MNGRDSFLIQTQNHRDRNVNRIKTVNTNAQARDFLNCLDQLSRGDKVTLAIRLLKLAQPDKTRKFDLPVAMDVITKTPPMLRYPLGLALLEADKTCGGELSKDDVINLAVTLLFLTQNHHEPPGAGGLTATSAHDFTMEAHLQQLLHRC